MLIVTDNVDNTSEKSMPLSYNKTNGGNYEPKTS